MTPPHIIADCDDMGCWAHASGDPMGMRGTGDTLAEATDDYLQQYAKENDVSEWQDIKTAPKDGSDILIGGDHSYLGGVVMASWRNNRWLDMQGDYYRPTHWMPLPPAPVRL